MESCCLRLEYGFPCPENLPVLFFFFKKTIKNMTPKRIGIPSPNPSPNPRPTEPNINTKKKARKSKASANELQETQQIHF